MHIHFIGICGVAMSALAIAFDKQGHTVTGSDKGFYPPVSDYLKKQGIRYYPGWHPEKMTANGDPDLVIVGNVAGSKNPEWLYVQEHKLNYLSYPEAIATHLIQDTSIVCAGTYGKTTTTTLLAWIFTQCGVNPSYMFGGLTQSDFPAAAMTDGDISIVEGDEYKTARWDNKAKFYHYKPTQLLLTAAEWDHADVYPTEDAYFSAFEDLIDLIPTDGFMVYSDDVPDRLKHRIEESAVPALQYGNQGAVQISDIELGLDGMSFSLQFHEHSYRVETPLLDVYNAKNIAGCFAIAHHNGLRAPDILEAIRSFPGIKRRLEMRQSKGGTPVFDDIAHSPAKAASVLQTLKRVISGNIYAVFEPNTGNRQPEAVAAYDNAFADAHEVIIGRLSTIKKDPTKAPALDGPALTEVIGNTHPHVTHLPDDNELVDYLISQVTDDDAIVFLGSHGFRGMIEQTCQRLS